MATQQPANNGPNDLASDKAGMPASAENVRSRIGALASMRFLAALVIFFHHVEGFFGLPDSTVPFRKIAVSFFFVLSGFLLTLIYSQLRREFNTKNFLLRRVQRIYPLHWAGLAITVALAFGFYKRAFEHAWFEWLWELIQTIFLVQTWNPLDTSEKWINGVTWSLSVLVFFYLIFPVVFSTRRYWASWTIGVAAASLIGVWVLSRLVAAGLIEEQQSWRIVHFFPPLRAIEFVLGMAAACLYVNMSRRHWLVRVASRPKTASILDVVLIVSALVSWQWGTKVLAPQISDLVQARLATVAPANHHTEKTISRKSFDSRVTPSEQDLSFGEPDSSGARGVLLNASFVDTPVSFSQIRVPDDQQTPSSQSVKNEPIQSYRVQELPQSEPESNTYDGFSAYRLMLRWFGYVGFSLPACVLIVWFASSRGMLAWVLARRWLVSLGDLSFAFFLIHRPIILFTDRSLESLTNDAPIPGVFICLVLTLSVSWLMYLLVENPVCKRKPNVSSGKRSLSRYLSSVRQGLANPGHRAIGALCIGGILLIPVYSSTTSDVGLRPYTPNFKTTYQSGLQLEFQIEKRKRTLQIDISRLDDLDLPGKVFIHLVDSKGHVIARKRVADLEASPEFGTRHNWRETTVRFREYEDLSFVRCTYLPKARELDPVCLGPSDRRNRGAVVWVARS